MAEHITDTLDVATIAVMRRAFGNEPYDALGPLDLNEACRVIRRARRLAAVARAVAGGVNVKVMSLPEAAKKLWDEA